MMGRKIEVALPICQQHARVSIEYRNRDFAASTQL
jgi:hypothetical protein